MKKNRHSIQFTTKELSLNEIDRGIERLKKRRGEVLQLDPTLLASGDPIRSKVERSIRDTVVEIFGENSLQAGDFMNPHLYHNPFPVSLGYGDEAPDEIPFFTEGIKKMEIELQGLIEILEERREVLSANDGISPNDKEKVERAEQEYTKDVFIVHGHDDAAKSMIARFVQQLGLKPIILNEQVNQGSTTIIEKLERHSSVQFAIILLTPDDVGNRRDCAGDLNLRARQNVILELGYFLGKLGRSGVCPLYKSGVEIPSDFSGIIYTLLDEHNGWKLTLAKELKAVWKDIDLNDI